MANTVPAMVMCFVPLCNHKGGKRGCRMFTFPRCPKTLHTWKILMRRGDASPNRYARICSCHFKDGNREKGPSIFPWNRNKVHQWKSPQKRKACAAKDVAKRNLIVKLKEIETEGTTSSSSEPVPCTSGVASGSPIESGDVSDLVSMVMSNDVGTNTDPDLWLDALLKENAALRGEIEDLKRRLVESTPTACAAENFFLKEEISKLKKELDDNRDVFVFRTISDKDDLVLHFTGLPNKESFFALLKLMENVKIKYALGWNVTRLDSSTQLFLTLLKLRRGLSNLDLASRFKISSTSVANIFISWLVALHHVLVVQLMASIPARQKNQRNLPECFSGYENTRIIIDCTEVTTANPTLIVNQNKMYSSYKHKITSKALVGIAPNGTVTFVSKLFPGSTSDRNVVLECGILKHLVPGDAIMADKGFNIDNILPDGVELNIPPFKETPQFTAEQVRETVGIAIARIHVERAISRIKSFKILNFIPQTVLPYASEIFRVCAALTTLQLFLVNVNKTSDSDDD